MKKIVLGVIIAVVVIGGGAYMIASNNSKTKVAASQNVTTTDNKKAEPTDASAQTEKSATEKIDANNQTNNKSNIAASSDSVQNNTTNSNNKVSTSNNTTQSSDVKTNKPNTQAQGSVSFDMQNENSQSSVKATPLTSSQLSKFVGAWTFGKSIAYNGGGAAYPDEGIPNLPGKKFTINQNSINLCGDNYNIYNYYMTKQSATSGVYGHPGLLSSEGSNKNPLNSENGYYTILTANNEKSSPSLASVNSGIGMKIQFFVIGNKLALDNGGVVFIATKDN